MTEDEEENL